MRKAIWMVCLAASTTLVGCGDESNGQPAPDYVRKTIELVEHVENETVTHTDVEMVDSVGDILTFANPVFDKANTKQVATDQGYCVRTEVGKSWECEWTMFLEDGQISVAGPFYDTKESELAITGGTGAYEQASGEMHLGFRDVAPPKVEYDFVYHVIVPY